MISERYFNLFFAAIFFISLFVSSLASLAVLLVAGAALMILSSKAFILKPAGGWRFWIIPSIFLALAPLFYGEMLSYSIEGAYMSAAVFIHLYFFNCAINLLNYSLRPSELYFFLLKMGWKRAAMIAFLALCVLERLKRELSELHSYAKLFSNSRFYFLKAPGIFFYAMLRNAVAAALNISRLLYMRDVEI